MNRNGRAQCGNYDVVYTIYFNWKIMFLKIDENGDLYTSSKEYTRIENKLYVSDIEGNNGNINIYG